jgi:hypothetical protein
MPDEIKKPKTKGSWIPFVAVALFSTLVKYPIPTLVVVAIIALIYFASKKGRIPKMTWGNAPGTTIPSGGSSTGEKPNDFDFGSYAEPTQPNDGSPMRKVLLFAAVGVAVGLVLYLIFGQA